MKLLSLIEVKGELQDPIASTDPVAYELLGSALNGLLQITAVKDATELEAALKSIVPAKTLLKRVDEDHKDIKEPFLNVTRALDEFKREFHSKLDGEIDRVARVAGAYQAEEKRKADEVARLEREKIEEAQKVAAAAQAALQAKLDAAVNPVQQKIIETKIEKTFDTLIETTQASVAKIHAAAPKGGSGRGGWDITVHDPKAFYAKYPHLCNIEPRLADIKAALNAGLIEKSGHGLTAVPNNKAMTRV